MVKLIYNIDEPPKYMEMDGPEGFKTKALNYFNYITPKVTDDPVGNPKKVFVGFVFERAGLEAMLANPDYDGIRCYLVRDDSGEEKPDEPQKTIGLLAVPIVKQTHDNGRVTFINQLGDKDIIFYPDCRSTHCADVIDTIDDLF